MAIINIILLILIINGTNGANRRTTTTTTTTEASTGETLSLSERELNLELRELGYRERENVFRERELKLSERELVFKEREDKLSKREQNIEKREQNTIRSTHSCLKVDNKELPDFSRYRYDFNDGMKLKEIGELGTCPENMRFFAFNFNSTGGTCDCDYFKSCQRGLIYSTKYQQCFQAYSQGPCEQTEWYVYDKENNPICELNPCPLGEGANYYIKSDGKCYKAGTKGYCKGRNERLFITPEDPVPKCRNRNLCTPQSIPSSVICSIGSKTAMLYSQGEECGGASSLSDEGEEGEEEEVKKGAHKMMGGGGGRISDADYDEKQ